MTSAWRIGDFQAMIARVSINGRSTSVEETNVLTSGTNSSLTVNFQPFSFLMRCNEWSRCLYSSESFCNVASTAGISIEQREAIRSEVISLPTANKIASIFFSCGSMGGGIYFTYSFLLKFEEEILFLSNSIGQI